MYLSILYICCIIHLDSMVKSITYLHTRMTTQFDSFSPICTCKWLAMCSRHSDLTLLSRFTPLHTWRVLIILCDGSDSWYRSLISLPVIYHWKIGGTQRETPCIAVCLSRGGGVQTSFHSKLPEGNGVSGAKSIQWLYSDRKQRDIQPTVKYPWPRIP